jgi:hypothetical protein
VWGDPEARLLCYRLDGGETRSDLGEYYLFIILNEDFNLRRVDVPKLREGMSWRRVIDTSLPSGEDFLDGGKEVVLDPSDFYLANPRSTVLLLGR